MRELCEELNFALSTTYALIMPLERVLDHCKGTPDIQTKEIMTKVKQAMGLDENRQLDPAFLVRREAQEILDLA